jgi:hypothetical protein
MLGCSSFQPTGLLWYNSRTWDSHPRSPGRISIYSSFLRSHCSVFFWPEFKKLICFMKFQDISEATNGTWDSRLQDVCISGNFLYVQLLFLRHSNRLNFRNWIRTWFFQMNIEVILYKRGVKKKWVQCLIICIAVCCCKHTRLLRNVIVKFSALLSNEMYTFPLGYNYLSIYIRWQVG